MKSSLLFLLLLSSSVALAQDDAPAVSEINAVWKKDGMHYPLKKGFYKNYDEFLNNAPSVQREFTIKEKTKSEKQKEKGIGKVNFKLDDDEGRIGKFWGFSDGQSVYVKMVLSSNYWRLDYVGPNGYFGYKEPVRSMGSLIVAATKVDDMMDLMVIRPTGKPFNTTVNEMTRILKRAPGLAEEYNNSDSPRSDKTKKEFLRRLNEYVASHPVSS